MKRFRPIVLVADIVCVLTIALLGSAMPAQAKQCHAARPSNAQSYWSYRLIDGRKCWYEGRPGFSKSLLQWSAAQTAEKAEKNTRREPDARPASTASKYNPLDAQASITSDAEAKTNPETADRIAAPSKGNLNSDDLRAWGNTKMATAGEPVLKIMDRWPDEELRQRRNAPVPAAQSSGMGGRTILMVVIIFMALSAVLMTTFRKANGKWRFPFWPGRTSRRQTAAWY